MSLSPRGENHASVDRFTVAIRGAAHRVMGHGDDDETDQDPKRGHKFRREDAIHARG